MTVRTKIILRLPIWWWRNYRARVLVKKIKKWKDQNRYPNQWKIKHILKIVKKLLKMMKITVNVKGYENIPKGTFLMTPNHTSSMDPAFILQALKNPSFNKGDFQLEPLFLAKQELNKSRFRGYLNILDTFYISRDNPREALKQINQYLDFAKSNQKIAVVFPEGTRSKDGKLQQFKGGAFRIAKQGFLPILPVTINNALESTNIKRKKWLNVEVIFHPIVKPLEFIALDTQSIGDKIQKIIEKDLKKSNRIEQQSELNLA